MKEIFVLIHGVLVFVVFLVMAGVVWAKVLVWWVKANESFDPLIPRLLIGLGAIVIPLIPALMVGLAGVWTACYVVQKIAQFINREPEVIQS